MERVSTGIKELDEKIGGGYPKNRSVLVTGTTGSGKTILGLHFINDGCKNNKKCLIIATEESPEDMLAQAESIGFPLEKYCQSGLLTIDKIYEERTEYAKDGLAYGLEEIDGLQCNIIGLLDRIPKGTDIALIDNIGVFTLNMSLNEFRVQFDILIKGLTKRNMTSMVIMDSISDERMEGITSYSVNGLIRILMKDNPFTGARERFIEFLKIRNTKIPLDPVNIDITSQGIVLLKNKNN